MKGIPSRQGITDPQTKRVLDALAENAEVLGGSKGDPSEHAVRNKDVKKESSKTETSPTEIILPPAENINIVRAFAPNGRTISFDTSFTELSRATITTTGRPVAVLASMATRILLTGGAGLSGTLSAQLMRDDLVIWPARLVVEFQANGVYPAVNSQMCTITISDNPSDGQHTYALSVLATQQAGVTAQIQVASVALVLISGFTDAT